MSSVYASMIEARDAASMVASRYNSTIASAEKVRDHRRRSDEHYANFLDSLKGELLYDMDSMIEEFLDD